MPSSTTLFAISALMFVVGGGVLYLLLRRLSSSGLKGVSSWIGMTVSVLMLLVGAGLTMIGLSAQVDTDFMAVDHSTLNKPAPELRFRLVDSNEEKTLADYQGKVVVLNLWATWCPPCLEEMESLNQLQRTYGDDLVVVAISDEPRQSIQKFEQNQIDLKMVSAYLPNEYKWPAPYNRVKESRPTTFIIDRDGNVRATWPGAKTYNYFAQVVQPYL